MAWNREQQKALSIWMNETFHAINNQEKLQLLHWGLLDQNLSGQKGEKESLITAEYNRHYSAISILKQHRLQIES